MGRSNALQRSTFSAAYALSPRQPHFGCRTWVNLGPFVQEAGLRVIIDFISIAAEAYLVR
jgi:hypothetical protein